jgi:hypothetical protein
VPYPPTIYSGATANVLIENLNLLNSYEAVKLERAGRFLVRNVHGFPSWRGLYIDMCLDIGRVENVHFWPFGGFWSVEDPLSEWINLNGTAFEFRRYDWCYVLNTFCFGYGVGYKFAKSELPDSAHGTTNGSLIGIGADACERAVLIEETSAPGLQFVNAELVGRWTSQTAVPIEIIEDSPQALLNLSNSVFWGPIDRCIWSRSENAHVIASSCTFQRWDVSASGSPAIDIEAGKAIIQGCNFLAEGTPIAVGEKVRSAIIMGNQAPWGITVRNEAGDRTQMVANERDPREMSDEALHSYVLDVGSSGDARFLAGWHHQEPALEWGGEGTKRWTTGSSRLLLPVEPGEPYQLTLDVHIPSHAAPSEEDGLYLDGERILGFPDEPGSYVLTVDLPAADSGMLELEIRAQAWMPSEIIDGSTDNRWLGVAVREVIMDGDEAGDRRWSANTGKPRP